MNFHTMKKYLKDFKVEASPFKQKTSILNGKRGWWGHSFWLLYYLYTLFAKTTQTVVKEKKPKKLENRKTVKP